MQGSGSTGSGPGSADAVNTDALNTGGVAERIAVAELAASGVDDADDRSSAEDTQVIDTADGTTTTAGGRSPGLIAAIVDAWIGTSRDLPNFVSVIRSQPQRSDSSAVMSASLRFRASLIRKPVTASRPSRVCQDAARTVGANRPAATSSASPCAGVRISGCARWLP